MTQVVSRRTFVHPTVVAPIVMDAINVVYKTVVDGQFVFAKDLKGEERYYEGRSLLLCGEVAQQFSEPNHTSITYRRLQHDLLGMFDGALGKTQVYEERDSKSKQAVMLVFEKLGLSKELAEDLKVITEDDAEHFFELAFRWQHDHYGTQMGTTDEAVLNRVAKVMAKKDKNSLEQGRLYHTVRDIAMEQYGKIFHGVKYPTFDMSLSLKRFFEIFGMDKQAKQAEEEGSTVMGLGPALDGHYSNGGR